MKHELDPKREFEKLIREMAYRHHLWRVFSDFCEMTAIALSNVVHFNQQQEDRYLKIVEAYDEKERIGFGKLLGITIKGLEDLNCDFLGEMFMGLDLGSHWHGQFFTPFHLCLMMAKMTLGDDAKAKIEEKGFITVQEPTCGAGALILGLAAAMKEAGFNYQKHLHVTAIDLDATAANMCYIQLYLHHIPAAVYTGNTLTMEMQSVCYTLAHKLGLWDYRFRDTAPKSAEAQAVASAQRADILLPDSSQYQLFEMREAA